MRTRGMIVSLTLAVVFCAGAALAQWQTIGNLDSFTTHDQGVTLKSGGSLLQVSFLASDLVRIRAARDGAFLPDQSAAVVKTVWTNVPWDLRDSDAELRLETSELVVRIQKKPLRVTFLTKEGVVLNADDGDRGISWSGSAVRTWKMMPQAEQIYGLGEKAGALNRKYRHLTMWNKDIPAYKADTDPLYQTIPFFYGINGGRAYGIFFDNSYWSSAFVSVVQGQLTNAKRRALDNQNKIHNL